MVRCKNCAFFQDGFCWRAFDETGNQEDLHTVDEDKEPCEFAQEPEE